MALYCGVMSGTSLDGVDVAFVDIDLAPDLPAGLKVQPRGHGFRPYTDRLAVNLHTLRSAQPTTIGTVCETHTMLGWVYADAIEAVAREKGIDASAAEAIGLHGQTVWHSPTYLPGQVRRHGTMQLGQPAIVAELVGVPVVSDFRAADMAAGGQGAPLAPFADFALFASADEDRVILNLGGITNITYLPNGCSLRNVVGFDCGPGNLLLDGVMRRLTGRSCDEGGVTAAKGAPSWDIVHSFLSHEYFHVEPPKSTGAETFGDAAVDLLVGQSGRLTIADTLATACEVAAKGVTDAIRKFLPSPPSRVIAGGGGTHNNTLMARLAANLDVVSPDIRLETHEAYGVSSDAKEAIAFAILAAARMHEIPASIPSVTGAVGPRVLGVVSLPPAPLSPSSTQQVSRI